MMREAGHGVKRYTYCYDRRAGQRTKLTQTEWYNLQLVGLSPAQRVLLNLLRRERNRPVAIGCIGHFFKGGFHENALIHLNERLRSARIPFRLRKVETGRLK